MRVSIVVLTAFFLVGADYDDPYEDDYTDEPAGGYSEADSCSGPPDCARDWRDDPDIVGCWFITDSATFPLENECNPGTHDASVVGGATPANYAYTTNLPGGSRATAFSLEFKDNVADIEVAHHVDLEQTAFSAGCWANVDDLAPAPIIPGKWSTTGWWVRAEAAGNASMRIHANAETSAAGLITENTWAWLAGTWATGGEVIPYLDGVSVCDGACSTSSGTVADDRDVQFRWSAGVYLDGEVHECFYIGRRLDDDEMCELCTCGIYGDAAYSTRNALCGSCDATTFGGACR